jgi:toxin-antitoxin system PIN domain toxin
VRFLLDVNVLVALAVPSHVSHQRAHSWFRREPDRLWATCPLTQAGFLRVASRVFGGPGGAAASQSVGNALAALEHDCRNPGHEYWPLDIDLRDLSDSYRSRLIGPHQVADMLLLMLAHRHRGQLVTFDTGIRELASGTRYAHSLLVL